MSQRAFVRSRFRRSRTPGALRLAGHPNPQGTSFTHPPTYLVRARRRAADRIARASRKANR